MLHSSSSHSEERRTKDDSDDLGSTRRRLFAGDGTASDWGRDEGWESSEKQDKGEQDQGGSSSSSGVCTGDEEDVTTQTDLTIPDAEGPDGDADQGSQGGVVVWHVPIAGVLERASSEPSRGGREEPGGGDKGESAGGGGGGERRERAKSV
ncbi:hypothetical protein VUR80DRAFT_7399 [Thermomyces stellatus]